MARRLAAQQDFLPVEREVRAAGYKWIAGLDEAGRGPLAGPVVAAAVVLPADCHILGLQDSKRLTARQREVVYSRIQQQAVAYGIGSVSHVQIDQHDILWATKEAMLNALPAAAACSGHAAYRWHNGLANHDCPTSYHTG